MSGRSIIVTGGFGALGRAVSSAFAAQGDEVARIDFAPSAQDDNPGGLDLPGIDLTDAAAVDQALAQVIETQGGVDVLVNIAGGFIWETLAEHYYCETRCACRNERRPACRAARCRSGSRACTKMSFRSPPSPDASARWWRRRYRRAGCIAARDPRTTNASNRRPAPVLRSSLAGSGLIRARATRISILPETRRYHQLTQRLVRDLHIVTLCQILGRQRRTEVAIMFADQCQHTLAKLVAEPPIARQTASARYQAIRTICAKPDKQPADLTSRQTEQHRCIRDTQFATLDAQQRVISRELAMAHADHRYKRILLRRTLMPPDQPPDADYRTSLSSGVGHSYFAPTLSWCVV
jgi:NAD(P)-dependent dehydrogenase (short-subunit alcohol dehydrogenase family)